MSKTADILIYEIIGGSIFEEGITAKNFRKDFKALEADADVSEINIRINSPGGSLFDGIAIYNIIKQSTKPVNTYIDGIAYSMAGIIALSAVNGGKVYAAKNATLLIHNSSGGAWGNAKKLRGTIETMEKLDNAMAETIASRTGLTAKEVSKKWLDYEDHTLSADEALEAKLIDEVSDLTAEIPTELTSLRGEELFAFFAKMNSEKEKESFFDKLVAKLKPAVQPAEGSLVQADSTPQSNNQSIISNMKMKISTGLTSLVALLAFTASADQTEMEVEITASHLETINAKLNELDAALKTANQDKTSLQAKLNEANQKLAAHSSGGQAPQSEGDADPDPEPEASYLTSYDRMMAAAKSKGKKK